MKQIKRTSFRPTSFLAAGIALVAAGTVLVPSAASAASAASAPAVAAPSPSELGPRLERACLRIPNIETRTENLIARLQGDATVRGSLAWLEVQIDKAEQRGRTDLAEVLTNRLAVRRQTLEVLQQRQSEVLPRLKQFCADHGVAV